MQDQDVFEPEEAVVEPVMHPGASAEDAVPQAAPDVAPEPDPHLAQPALPSFVYAIGQIEPRFPTLGLEKELAQVTGRRGDEGLTDRQALRTVISERLNRYLARQLCWVFLIEGVETYILLPRDPGDFELLIEAVREYPRRDDVDVVIGTRGQIAPPEMCNGLSVPLVVFDQIYSFDRDSLIEAIPRPDSVPQKREAQFRQTAGGLFDRIMQMGDNAGTTDEHRALNYLAVRYPRIYATVAEAHERNASLTGVEVRQSALSGVRRIVDIIFSTTHRETDVTDKHFVRVDVTEEYPFLVTQLSPYYDVQ
jgi:hypothetical protein